MKQTTTIIMVLLMNLSMAQDSSLLIKAENNMNESTATLYVGIGFGIVGGSILMFTDKKKQGSIILGIATINFSISRLKHRNATSALIEHQKQF